MSRSILITGAGGFVGSHLAEGLAALGHAVTGLDCAFDTLTRERLSEVRLIETELNSAELNRLQGRFDVVVHGAAITSTPAELGMTGLRHVRVNTDLLIDCLDYALSAGARQFVFLSSSGVFAPGDGDPLFESTPPAGRSAYAVAKRAGELITLAVSGGELTALVARLGPVYGPHEVSRHSRRTTSLVRRYLDQRERFGALTVESPYSRRDWTFAPDLARALDALFGRPERATGIIHLTASEIVSDLALAQTLAMERPGTSVEVAPDFEPDRVPMVSERSELADFAWTPLADGLRLMQDREVPA